MTNLPTIPITTQKLTVDSPQTLLHATKYLSELNTSLDTLTAHKEQKTKPLNEALKAIRKDYKPLEEQLEQAIAATKSSILHYQSELTRIAKEKEAHILADKRTSLTTKINALAEIDNTHVDKVTSDTGSITFTTVKKYSLSPVEPTTDIKILAQLVALNILVLDTTTLKAYIKTTGTTPEGITVTEEQTLRNYR